MRRIGLELKKALSVLRKGGVLVCPTDTVYGLVCDARNKKAVKRLYKIKKRPRTKPLPIFVSGVEMAKTLAKINPRQEKYLKKVWPGAVTAVLPKKRGQGAIGLRVPKHDFILDLVQRIGPLTGTSANISGQPASTRVKEVVRQFENQKLQPDLIIDGGNLKRNKPSKVVDIRVFPPKILRI